MHTTFKKLPGKIVVLDLTYIDANIKTRMPFSSNNFEVLWLNIYIYIPKLFNEQNEEKKKVIRYFFFFYVVIQGLRKSNAVVNYCSAKGLNLT